MSESEHRLLAEINHLERHAAEYRIQLGEALRLVDTLQLKCERLERQLDKSRGNL